MHRNKKSRKRKINKNSTDSSRYFSRREIAAEIEAHFSKRFTFVKPSKSDLIQWELPNAEELFTAEPFVNETLTSLKNDLNCVKDLLSDKDIVQWHQHTHNVNIASKVVPHIRNRMQAELCTQAWCKFYEILCTFSLVPCDPTLTTLNSVHLCEAPGAFIAALNHYLVLNHTRLKLSWLATTLNPYYEGNKIGQTIPDDRFILPTLEHWDFGCDNTGNIFSNSNRTALYERAKMLGPIHLVTADGSIDCQNNPSEQESLVAPLHLVEVVTALHILAPSGNLVVKMFTCFETTSICLLYLLNCAFSQVHVFKPGTSKRGNSEVYVVGMNYLGQVPILAHLSKIENYLGQSESIPSPMVSWESLPSTFICQVVECCTYFQKLQIEAIHEHLRLFENMDAEQSRHLERTKFLVSQTFVRKYAVAPISPEASIIKNKVSSIGFFQRRPLREGSLNHRKSLTSLSWHQKLVHLEAEFVNASAEVNANTSYSAVESIQLTSDTNFTVNVTVGDEFQECFNSYFCNISVLKCWNEICHCAKEFGEPMSWKSDLDSPSLSIAILNQLSPDNDYHFVAGSQCHALAAHLTQSWHRNCVTGMSTKVFVADLRYRKNLWDNLYSSQKTADILNEFCSTLEACKVNDVLAIVINPLLTRVEVGLLYILSCSFRKISLLPVATSNQPLELAICHGYSTPVPSSVIESLKQNQDMISNAVLEVVPVPSLFGEPFYTPLYNFNSFSLLQRVKHMISYLKTNVKHP